jgi:hypothetical protein
LKVLTICFSLQAAGGCEGLVFGRRVPPRGGPPDADRGAGSEGWGWAPRRPVTQ